MTIMSQREGLRFDSPLVSDCAPLNDLVAAMLAATSAPGAAAGAIHCLRDATRGGLATALCEIAAASHARIRIRERDVPVRREVRNACELLGLDPLYVACEGRLVALVPAEEAERALAALRAHPRGSGAARIGEVSQGPAGLLLETLGGGTRPLYALEGAQLPRIC